MAEKGSTTEKEAQGRGKDIGKSKKEEKARTKESRRTKRKTPGKPYGDRIQTDIC